MRYNLTPSIYSFEDLRKYGYLYVDKTAYLWNLIRNPGGIYFLARPRRFGKSLTISTLEAIFRGKRELFQGLALYDKPYDWQSYPIIHVDMANCSAHTPDELRQYCVLMLKGIAKQYGVDVPITASQLSMGFEMLVNALAGAEGKVVILIDEYDKPILENLTNTSREAIRDALGEFYSTVKKTNRFERFVFVTGVTKFCHVSLFSNLNNLVDLSMHEDYATMLGYTQEELEANFGDWLIEAEERNTLPHDQFMNEIKNWYDGYRFHANASAVYNPVSLVSFFMNHGDFRNYWFTTGTTGALLKLMKEQNFNLPEALENSVLPNFFEAFELEHINLKMLLYQTGYLTIARTVEVKIPYTDISNTEYVLAFPNYEVKRSFDEHLLEYYTNIKTDQSLRLISELVQNVGSGNVNGFVDRLRVLFANIPYDMRGTAEQDYQTIFYVIFMMLHFYIDAEHRTNDGRVDIMLEAGDWIYVIEFKLNKSASEAMTQIENEEYALKFRHRGKRVMAIGINFDSQHGQITDWLSQQLPE